MDIAKFLLNRNCFQKHLKIYIALVGKRNMPAGGGRTVPSNYFLGTRSKEEGSVLSAMDSSPDYAHSSRHEGLESRACLCVGRNKPPLNKQACGTMTCSPVG